MDLTCPWKVKADLQDGWKCFLSSLLAGADVGDMQSFCWNVLPMFGQPGSITTESSRVSLMAQARARVCLSPAETISPRSHQPTKPSLRRAREGILGPRRINRLMCWIDFQCVLVFVCVVEMGVFRKRVGKKKQVLLARAEEKLTSLVINYAGRFLEEAFCIQWALCTSFLTIC